MSKISIEQLQEIIESHGKWLKNEEGGQRADLRDADLQGAYLRGADLRDADLQDADLRDADLRGADLPNGIYQVVGCGSNNRCTTYDIINDRVICGCWNDNNGNHLADFEQRINNVYGVNGNNPNVQYYKEYMAAIAFFKEVRK